MGVSVSIPALEGLRTAGAALDTTYAFDAGNTNQFGVQATISASNGPGSLYPVVTFPARLGGASIVTCQPTVNLGLTTVSILCPIANSVIGAGTATLAFSATLGGPQNPTAAYSPSYIFALTTQSTDTVTKTSQSFTATNTQTVDAGTIYTETPLTTLTGASSTVYVDCTPSTTPSVTSATTSSCTTTKSTEGWPEKSSTTTMRQKYCRPLNTDGLQAYALQRRDAGYGGPDYTLSDGATLSAAISTTTTTELTATTTTETTTQTVTDSTTSTVDNRTVATVTGCPPVPT